LLKNTTRQQIVLDPRDLLGEWKSATFHFNRLGRAVIIATTTTTTTATATTATTFICLPPLRDNIIFNGVRSVIKEYDQTTNCA
jgi:hypothetical protein